MKIFHGLIFAILMLMVYGCNTLHTNKPVATSCERGTLSEIKSKIAEVTHPPLGIETSQELGDSIIYRSKIYENMSILVAQPVYANGTNADNSFTLHAPAGRFDAEGKDYRGTFYKSLVGVTMIVKRGSVNLNGGLVIPETEDRHKQMYWHAADLPNIVLSIDANFDYILTEASDVLPGQLIKELIYNGRSGETVKFMYREFNDDLARPAFTQDVTYDLKIGDEIGFKGARFKILEASNTQIKYIALKNFD
jgi:hypothetical protein